MTINQIESLAKKLYREFEKDGDPITMEEAREMAEMELKAKSHGKGRIVSEDSEEAKTKVRKPRVRKVDETKGRLLRDINTLLEGLGATNTEFKNEVELAFDFENNNYSIRLIKHRAKKGE